MIGHLKDAETGQRGFVITGMDEYLEPYNYSRDSLQQHLFELESLIRDKKQLNLLNQIKPLVIKKYEELAYIINVRKKDGFEAAKSIVESNEGKIYMDEIRRLALEMKQYDIDLLKERKVTSKRNEEMVKNTIFTVTLVAIIIVIFLVIYYIRIIAIPLRNISIVANDIASGNLTSDFKNILRDDEVGKLSKAFQIMQRRLQEQLIEIKEGVNVLSSSASEIMSTVSQLSTSAAETATSISETTSTISEVRQTAKVSSQKAEDISKRAETSDQVANKGLDTIQKSLDGMHQIKEQMNSIAEIVIGLSEKSQSIEEIVSSVSDLSEQSNLLAVNASIEAAKAGEHGRGFSIVAQEIKNLATRSKESTKQIRGLVRLID
jgi:methyl-accepting chemotaxis protein